MAWTAQESVEDGFTERRFAFDAPTSGSWIPGVYRTPTGGGGDRLVLLGHGGSTDKHAPYIVDVARQLARARHRLHGDRRPRPRRACFGRRTVGLDWLARAWNDGGGTDAVVSDWGEALDFVEGEFGARTTGWWGLSMGTMMGLPVSAGDERIRVALLGLMGVGGPNGDDLERCAPQLACPSASSCSGTTRSSRGRRPSSCSDCSAEREEDAARPTRESTSRCPDSKWRRRSSTSTTTCDDRTAHAAGRPGVRRAVRVHRPDTGDENVHEMQGDLGVFLHQRAHVPRRQTDGRQVAGGGHRGGTGLAVEDAHLAERIAGTVSGHLAPADRRRRRSLDDHEHSSESTTVVLDDHLLTRRELVRLHLGRDLLGALAGQPGKQRDRFNFRHECAVDGHLLLQSVGVTVHPARRHRAATGERPRGESSDRARASVDAAAPIRSVHHLTKS